VLEQFQSIAVNKIPPTVRNPSEEIHERTVKTAEAIIGWGKGKFHYLRSMP
jgi:hypothetical protein